MSDDGSPTALARLADLVVATGGSLAGYAVGGLEGALIGGATPAAVNLALHAGNAAVAARITRGSRALDTAASELGVSLDELADRASADPAHLELLARVLEASGRTPLADKVDALGRVLARGLDPEGKIDEALFLAAALHDVEAPHILALKHLCSQPPSVVALHEEDFRELFANADLVLSAVLQQLLRHGLVEVVGIDGGGAGVGFADPDDGGGFVYACTALGRQCLDLLRSGG